MITLDKEGKELVARHLANKIGTWQIKESLKQVCEEKLKESDIKEVLPKACEKAIKDIAKWKLTRENVYYGIKLEKLESEHKALKEDFKVVVKELQQINNMFSVKVTK